MAILRLAVVGVLGCCLLSGCGGDGEAGEDASPAGEDAGVTSPGTTPDWERIRGAIVKIRQVVPTATEETEPLESIRTQNVTTMSGFLTAIIQNVDRYWTRTLTAANIPEPSVSYVWMEPGQSAQTKCTDASGSPVATNDQTAAYCGPDDTIFVSQQFAIDFWNGFVGGQQSTVSPGDFGVAYVVAHEYAHNVQHELGIAARTDIVVRDLELQADCMSGTWANSAYYEGILEAGDVEEAIASADLVGDYDFLEPQHHGTPAERVAAWRLGYDTGNPAECNRYLPSG